MTDVEGEIWLPVVDYEDLYQVSNLARVMRVGVACGATAGYILNPCPVSGGYPTVWLSKDNRRRARRVHLLVAIAFLGPCPDGKECRHLDGKPENAKLSNLAWGTKRENEADKLIHGTRFYGENTNGAVLSNKDVYEIRELLAKGDLYQREIAAIFKISQRTVSQIKSGERWSRLQ